MAEYNALIEHAERIGLNGEGMRKLGLAIKRLPLDQAQEKLRVYGGMQDRMLPSEEEATAMTPEQKGMAYERWNRAYTRWLVVDRAVFEKRTAIKVTYGRWQIIGR